MMRGLGRSHLRSMNAASVLGSPRSTASAATPLISFRYQAQMMGDPVESVSGDLWPKTRVVIGGDPCAQAFRAPYRIGLPRCHALHSPCGGWPFGALERSPFEAVAIGFEQPQHTCLAAQVQRTDGHGQTAF